MSSRVVEEKMAHKRKVDALYPDLEKSIFEHMILMDGLDIKKSQSIMRDMLKYLEDKDCSSTMKLAILRAMSNHILYALDYTEQCIMQSNNTPSFKKQFKIECDEFRSVHHKLLANFDKELDFYKNKKYNQP
jgi:hypothetical protein